MMIGELGQEKIELTELSNIWRLCCDSDDLFSRSGINRVVLINEGVLKFFPHRIEEGRVAQSCYTDIIPVNFGILAQIEK